MVGRVRDMSDLRINWIDDWEKKEVELSELMCVLEEGDSARYSGKAFRDNWRKAEEVRKARHLEPVSLKGGRGR